MRGAETIVINRAGGVDWQGDPDPSLPAQSYTVGQCQLWPRVSSEDSENGRKIVEGWNVYIPPQTVVVPLATDTVTIRGELHQVVGVPGQYDIKGRDKGTILVTSKAGV